MVTFTIDLILFLVILVCCAYKVCETKKHPLCWWGVELYKRISQGVVNGCSSIIL